MSDEVLLSRDQVRQVDAKAINDYGIPGIVLMENASRHLFTAAKDMLAKTAGSRVAIVCGTGNNAGDGFALARHLHNAEFKPVVLITSQESRISGDALTNLKIIKRMTLDIHSLTQDQQGLEKLRIELQQADLIVDAILGTGLSGPVRGFYRQVIEEINSQAKPILAVDIPSGLDCDTGQPLGLSVRASTTVTFVATKKGFATPGAQAYTGKAIVADIGAPRELIS